MEASRFEAASLRLTAAAITSEALDLLAVWPWTLAQGSRNRKRRGGLQYCPGCLMSDRKPYYRLQWRLAWHICCPTHGLCLLDRCPRCNAPLEPQRLSAEVRHLATCATCKCDLRDADTSALEPTALAFQVAADKVITAGYGCYGGEKLAVDGWFRLSRYFVMLLRKIALSSPKGLTALANGVGVDTDNLRPPATGLALELLPVEERALFLAGAWKMLDAGPTSFLAAASEASLAQASLREQRQPVPDPILALIEDLPDKSVCRTLKAPVGILKPRSRQGVKRMFALLQRKMRTTAR